MTPPSHDGPAFYDDAGVFDAYAQLRADGENANDTIDRPMMNAVIGDPAGQDIIDLGCGDASYGRDLLAAGARSYLGIDGSRNMVALAEATLRGSAGRALHADLAAWQAVPASASLVCSRLALHYLPDLAALFTQVHAALRPGGRFVYSTEHPVITAHDAAPEVAHPDTWTVDDYFVTGPRDTRWLGAEVRKYHRTVEDHFLALRQAGFQVEQLRESRPERANFATEAGYQRRLRVPLFLYFGARKA